MLIQNILFVLVLLSIYFFVFKNIKTKNRLSILLVVLILIHSFVSHNQKLLVENYATNHIQYSIKIPGETCQNGEEHLTASECKTYANNQISSFNYVHPDSKPYYQKGCFAGKNSYGEIAAVSFNDNGSDDRKYNTICKITPVPPPAGNIPIHELCKDSRGNLQSGIKCNYRRDKNFICRDQYNKEIPEYKCIIFDDTKHYLTINGKCYTRQGDPVPLEPYCDYSGGYKLVNDKCYSPSRGIVPKSFCSASTPPAVPPPPATISPDATKGLVSFYNILNTNKTKFDNLIDKGVVFTIKFSHHHIKDHIKVKFSKENYYYKIYKHENDTKYLTLDDNTLQAEFIEMNPISISNNKDRWHITIFKHDKDKQMGQIIIYPFNRLIKSTQALNKNRFLSDFNIDTILNFTYSDGAVAPVPATPPVVPVPASASAVHLVPAATLTVTPPSSLPVITHSPHVHSLPATPNVYVPATTVPARPIHATGKGAGYGRR